MLVFVVVLFAVDLVVVVVAVVVVVGFATVAVLLGSLPGSYHRDQQLLEIMGIVTNTIKIIVTNHVWQILTIATAHHGPSMAWLLSDHRPNRLSPVFLSRSMPTTYSDQPCLEIPN